MLDRLLLSQLEARVGGRRRETMKPRALKEPHQELTMESALLEAAETLRVDGDLARDAAHALTYLIMLREAETVREHCGP